VAAEVSLPPDLLARPAGEAVRRLALAELARAERARDGLLAGDDPEALHDFRVALRRLRSHLRAYRSEVGSAVGRKLLRRLRDLAAATNPGRDAEVQVAWLDEVVPTLAPGARRGGTWLRERLAHRRDEAYRALEREVIHDFARLAARLRERLARLEVDLDEGAARGEPLADAARDRIGEHLASLRHHLAAVHGPQDEDEAHAARIEAKRLRYLLDPLVAWLAKLKRPLARLRELQDLLGEWNDTRVLAEEVTRALEEIEAQRARRLLEATLAATAGESPPRSAPSRERSGLLALARELAARRHDRFTRFAAGWSGDEAPERQAFEAELETALAGLAPSAAAAATAADDPR
jgi:CHAD domain-containing protein